MSTTTPDASELDALQTALANEHAAVFVLGALGAATSASAAPALHGALTAAYAAHRARRDDLVALIVAAGQEPVAAEPGYELPGGLDAPASVTTHALAVEQTAAATYAFLVASTTGAARVWASEALVATAVSQLSFGAGPQDFPGLTRS